MTSQTCRGSSGPCLGALVLVIVACAPPALGALNLGAEELVQAGGADLTVLGYSVPSYTDWDNDGLSDLVIGEGGGGAGQGKVCIYLNGGSTGEPSFDSFSYVQSAGSDLVVTASGCMGCFPRVVYWDADSRKDLLVGTALGNVIIYLNVGTDVNPAFDGGTPLQFGPPGFKVDIDVGSRACPTVVDWDGDGLQDLVVGALDGRIHLFINTGTNTAPDYQAEIFARMATGDLYVFGSRASPVVADFDDDGKQDILTGNTYGQLLLYSNIGTGVVPLFDTYSAVEADGVPIDLDGTPRSRPFVCDWTGDGEQDVLIGAYGGQVHLYQGEEDLVPVPDTSTTVVSLDAPWPNPFNPRVTIAFEVTRPVSVSLEILDMRGRRVFLCAQGSYPIGRHQATWLGTDQRGHGLSSGVYVARLITPDGQATRKLNLIR